MTGHHRLDGVGENLLLPVFLQPIRFQKIRYQRALILAERPVVQAGGGASIAEIARLRGLDE